MSVLNAAPVAGTDPPDPRPGHCRTHSPQGMRRGTEHDREQHAVAGAPPNHAGGPRPHGRATNSAGGHGLRPAPPCAVTYGAHPDGVLLRRGLPDRGLPDGASGRGCPCTGARGAGAVNGCSRDRCRGAEARYRKPANGSPRTSPRAGRPALRPLPVGRRRLPSTASGNRGYGRRRSGSTRVTPAVGNRYRVRRPLRGGGSPTPATGKALDRPTTGPAPSRAPAGPHTTARSAPSARGPRTPVLQEERRA